MLNSILASNTKHSKGYQVIAILFITSLGFGEIVNVAGIKLSYITTILMIFCCIYETRGVIKLSSGKYQLHNLLAFCIIWAVYPLLQFIWVKNVDYWNSFYRSLFINILIIVLILLYINTWDDWKTISKAFIILHLFSLAVGYWEIYTGRHIVQLEGTRNLLYYAYRPISFYGNGNDNAVILFFGLCNLLIFLFSHKTKIFHKILLALLSIATISQIIIIDARGATYSLVLLLVFILYFQVRLRLDKNNKMIGKLFGIATIVLIFVAIIWIFLAHPIEYYLSMFSGEGNYMSDLGRVDILSKSFIAFLNTLGFGLGPGQSIVVSGINLHNFYLEILFEYGIFVGGYLIYQIVKVGFCEYPSLSLLAKSIVRAFPFVMILLGVSSSKTFIMRPTWVLISLLWMLQYVGPAKEESLLKRGI